MLEPTAKSCSARLKCAICSGEALAVCTIEKANVTINRLIAEGRLGAQPSMNLHLWLHMATALHCACQSIV